MQKFLSNGIEIAFYVWGEGRPIVLVHGFASNATTNWVETGWVKFLNQVGMQVITLDNRGHGNSEKIYESSAYNPGEMAQDLINLINHLSIQKVSIMGYSMGARIAAFATLQAPERVECVIFGGLAFNLVAPLAGSAEIANALLKEKVSDISVGQARSFRLFADSTRSDRRALAACVSASRVSLTSAEIAKISCPVLIVAGEKDELAGSVELLNQLIANSKAVVLPDRNHMNAVGDPRYKTAVGEFLATQN